MVVPFNFDRLQRGVFSFSNSNTTSITLHFVCDVCMFCITGIILYVTIRERERERERERLIRVSLDLYKIRQFRERERGRERGGYIELG